MNIVHYVPRLRVADGGVVRAVIDLANGLSARGNGVNVVTTYAPDRPDNWSHSPSLGQPALITLDRGWLGPVIRGGRKSIEFAALLSNADVLHLHSLWSPEVAQLARLARRMKVPYVVTLHGVLDEWSMRQKRLKKRCYMGIVGRRVLADATIVHCTALAEREQTCKWYGETTSVIIPYLFDISPFSVAPDPSIARSALALPSDGRAVVLFLSRLHYKKRPDVLLEAAALLRERGVNVDVVIAGSGDRRYERYLRECAEALGIGSSCYFSGLVVDPVRASLLAAADVFVLPTWQENFGFVLVEALAAGTPVVTTTGVDIWKELSSGGGTVVLQSARSSEIVPALADAIVGIVQDPARRAEMSRRGRAHVFDWLEASVISERYVAMYERARREFTGEGSGTTWPT